MEWSLGGIYPESRLAALGRELEKTAYLDPESEA